MLCRSQTSSWHSSTQWAEPSLDVQTLFISLFLPPAGGEQLRHLYLSCSSPLRGEQKGQGKYYTLCVVFLYNSYNPHSVEKIKNISCAGFRRAAGTLQHNGLNHRLMYKHFLFLKNICCAGFRRAAGTPPRNGPWHERVKTRLTLQWGRHCSCPGLH